MERTLKINGNVITIGIKEKALISIEKYDVTTLTNISNLLKTEKARKIFNKNINNLKTFL